jgi:hypothetical protein
VSLSKRQGAGCFHLVFAGGVFGCRLMFPSAQAAELTSGHYRSFQEEGIEARVDLASQVLQLNVPEEKQYVWQHLETNAPEAFNRIACWARRWRGREASG